MMPDTPWADALALRDLVPPDVPETLTPLVQDVLDRLANLDRRERRLVVFGSYKAGKSALINRLVGASVVAEQAIDLSPEITPVPFDPLSGWVIVDTPGLYQDGSVTERILAEIGRGDLAIMVLGADQILSGAERETARQVNDLLRGNITFVVNRMDLIDPEERDDVMSWARMALEGLGNDLVGKPRLFAISAASDHPDLSWLEPWLRGLIRSDRIPLLARLAGLLTSLSGLRVALALEVETARSRVAQAEAEEAGRIDEYRGRVRAEIAEGRTRLRALASDLTVHDDAFLDAARAQARAAMGAGGGTVPWGVLVERYGEGIDEDVRETAADLPVTLPPFDLRGWIVQPEQIAITHPVAHTGSVLGQRVGEVIGDERVAEGGAMLGRWVARNVFQADVEGKVLRQVEATARHLLEGLHHETERYFGKVDALLQEADAYYAHWTRRQSSADELRRDVDRIIPVQRWAEELARRTEGVLREVEGRE